MTFITRVIEPNHRLDTFDCGNTQLNEWLVHEARRAQEHQIAHVTVWCHEDDDRVLAYHAIMPTSIRRDDLTNHQRRGQSVVPGYLIAKLAVDRTVQGQKVGSSVLLQALELIEEASMAVGGRLVVVDPVDEAAAAFYRHHGFVLTAKTGRLALELSAVRQLLRSD